jgi:hypothetical protein
VEQLAQNLRFETKRLADADKELDKLCQSTEQLNTWNNIQVQEKWERK